VYEEALGVISTKSNIDSIHRVSSAFRVSWILPGTRLPWRVVHHVSSSFTMITSKSTKNTPFKNINPRSLYHTQ